MKYISLFTLLIGLLLVLGSCKKTELDGAYQAYEGTWESFDSKMELQQNGRANYINFQSNRSINGRLIIDGNRLKINAVFAGKNFNIDQHPIEQENDAGEVEMAMVLDGMTFIRE